MNDKTTKPAEVGNAHYERDLAALREEKATLEARVSELEGDLHSANGRLGPAQQKQLTAESEIEQLKKRNARLTTQLASAKARGGSTSSRAPKSSSPRKVEAMEHGLKPFELQEKLAGGEYEVVFADGDKEITGIEPLLVRPGGWRGVKRGVALVDDEVLVHGAANGEAPFSLTGFGLFDRKGKQVAYRELPEPITVEAGKTVGLRNTITF